MKRSALLVLICLFILNNAIAATHITSPAVSGHWTLAGSPYYIHNHIDIDPGQSLTIDAGVQVLFKGPYMIRVWGSLRADGTSNAPIVFDVEDTTGWHVDTLNTFAGGWQGIYFSPYTSSTPDVSSLSYCHFQHLRWYAVTVDRAMHIQYCRFTINKGSALTLKGGPTGVHELNDCEFYDNLSAFGAVLTISSSKAEWYVHDNQFYDNVVAVNGSVVSCDSSTVLFSGNQVYNNRIPPSADSTVDAKVLRFMSYGNTPCYAVLSENKIFGNECNMSATIFCENAIVDLYRNYLCNNYHLSNLSCAISFGGGSMYLKGKGDYHYSGYTVRNNIIANNYSGLYGGGIAVYDAKALIANNTIVNNSAPRGGGIDLFMFDDVTACIRNNILYGNQSGHPGSVCVISLKKTKLKYDYNWSTDSFYKAFYLPPVSGGSVNLIGDTNTNVIGTNPGLASPTLTATYTEDAWPADFNISSGSPCIDKGVDSATVPGSADYAGNNRINGNAVDIGAYEYNATTASSGVSLSVDTMFKYCCTPILPMLLAHDVKSGVRVIEIYPNPASSIVFIKTPEIGGTVQITDVTGKQIMNRKVTNTVTSFDIRTLSRGFYNVIWYDPNNTQTTQKIFLE